MTRPETTNLRSLEFSNWIRDNLPDSATGFCVSDIDFVIWNYKTRSMMILEEKCFMAEPSDWFRIFLKEVLHPATAKYCKENNIDYRGCHLVQFTSTGPETGEIYFDRERITKIDLIDRLTI